MKKEYFLCAAVFLITSPNADALSGARVERGVSCTETCTKSVETDRDEAYLRLEIKDADMSTSKLKIDTLNKVCKKLSPTEKRNPMYAGNPDWCRENCSAKGGLVSRFQGRLDKVKEYIAYKDQYCDLTMQVYENRFRKSGLMLHENSRELVQSNK